MTSSATPPVAAGTETVGEKQQRLFGRGRDTGRIEYFSDAVFAIALTLLVLDLHVPEVTHPKTELIPALVQLLPQFFAYVLSFVIIAINWLFHHRKFRAIVAYDTGLIWLNFAFLLFVALVPFPTSLLSQYGPEGRIAIVLYALEVAVLSLLQAVIWAYARRHGLLAADIDDKLFRFVQRNGLASPLVFLLSIPLALVLPVPTWAMWFWILSWPASLIASRMGATRRVAVGEPGGLKD